MLRHVPELNGQRQKVAGLAEDLAAGEALPGDVDVEITYDVTVQCARRQSYDADDGALDPLDVSVADGSSSSSGRSWTSVSQSPITRSRHSASQLGQQPSSATIR